MTTVLSYISGTASLAYTSLYATNINANNLSVQNLSVNQLRLDTIGPVNNNITIQATTNAQISCTNMLISAQNVFFIGTTETISTNNWRTTDPVIQLNSGNVGISGGLILMSGTTLEYGRIQAVVSGGVNGMQFTTGLSTPTLSCGYLQATNVSITSATVNTISCVSAAFCTLSSVNNGVRISNGIIELRSGAPVAGVQMRLSDNLIQVSCAQMPVVIQSISVLNFETTNLMVSADVYPLSLTNMIGYTISMGVLSSTLNTYSSVLNTFGQITIQSGCWLAMICGSAMLDTTGKAGGFAGEMQAYYGIDILSNTDPVNYSMGRRVKVTAYTNGSAGGLYVPPPPPGFVDVIRPSEAYCNIVLQISTPQTYFLRGRMIAGYSGELVGGIFIYETTVNFLRIA